MAGNDLSVAKDSRTATRDPDAVVSLVMEALVDVLPRKKKKQSFPLSARLFNDIGLDSMQAIAFTFALEQRFKLTLPESELKKKPIESLQDVVDLILRIA
jgi:acyl carrier protein